MAFHIPFNQRASAQHRPGPVYIGFDVPIRARQRFNWWGFNGMWMSFASLLTAGFLAPLPLLVSLNGLRKPGKKMALTGTIVSLAGIAFATTVVVVSISEHNHHQRQAQRRHDQKVLTKQVAATNALLATAGQEISEFVAESGGFIQDEIEANMLVLKYVDPWKESLRLDAAGPQLAVRSGGPDKTFDTADDLTLVVSADSPAVESASMKSASSTPSVPKVPKTPAKPKRPSDKRAGIEL